MLIGKKVGRRIKDLCLWLLDARRLWATKFLVGVLLVFIFGYLAPGKADDRVRYCGLAFQLLGIIVVLYGLRQRQLMFNRPWPFVDLLDWLSRRPWGARPRFVDFGGISEVVSVTESAKLSIRRVVLPEASVEEKIKALEEYIGDLRTEQAKTTKDIRTEIKKFIEAVDLEHRTQDSAIRDMQTQLDKLGAGGLYLEWAGVFWLILGVILATIPGEIMGALR